jgi:hypothetical protein
MKKNKNLINEQKVDLDKLIRKIEKAFDKIASECIVMKNGIYEFSEQIFYSKAIIAFEAILKKSKIATTFLTSDQLSKIISQFSVQTDIKISKRNLKTLLKK